MNYYKLLILLLISRIFNLGRSPNVCLYRTTRRIVEFYADSFNVLVRLAYCENCRILR